VIDIDNRQIPGKFTLLDLAFRPFFLGAAAFSVLATLIWMAAYLFGWSIPFYDIPVVTWHAHEMIFGYSMAVIAGFLLTAVKNWTGIQTLNGFPLLLLFFLWLAGRVLPFLGESLPLEYVAITDSLFAVFLALGTTLPILRARQWKNLGIVTMPFLLLAGNVLFYAGVLGVLADGVNWGLYSGLYLVVALIFIMGRRVIPFFIEKGVGYPVQLKNRNWLDISSLVLFFMFWITDLFIAHEAAAALLAGVLAVLHGVRMAGWYTPGIWKKPLLWVLYLAYGSLLAGFVLKAAVYLFGISPFLAVHAFTFGGIGMMTIGMMSRVSLGHTGRNVFEPPAILFWIFAILFVGTIVRVLVPLLDPSHYTVWIGLSQALWIVSFSLFIYLYLPILVRPRADGR
jgi:uncharacterized protein involved in response to NO